MWVFNGVARVILFLLPVLLVNWSVVYKSNSITVFSRPVRGSSFLEVKGVTKVKAPLAGLVLLLHDAYSGCHSWMDYCLEKKLLKRAGLLAYYYNVSKVPWPFKNRDIVVKTEVLQNAETKEVLVLFSGIPNFVPERKEYERIQKLKGFWAFKPLAGNSVQVTYQFYAEPGGNLKAWMVNSFTEKNPYKALRKLREVIKLERYRSARLPEIEEP